MSTPGDPGRAHRFLAANRPDGWDCVVANTRDARVIVASPDVHVPELPGFAPYHDAERQFCSAYGLHRLARPVLPRAELDELSQQ